MQVFVNQRLIKRKARIGMFATLIGIAALVTGFFTSLRMSTPSASGQALDLPAAAAAYAVLIVALVAIFVGRYHVARWSRQPRTDQVLAEAVSVLDNRYSLLSYLPEMPVDHLLITPQGLLVIVAKHLVGEFRNQGDRWHRKFSLGLIFGAYSEGKLGNPSTEATRSIELVRAQVAAKLGANDVPVGAVIVFIDPRAILKIDDPVIPVIAPRELRDFVRTWNPQAKVAPERIEELANLFAPDRVQFKPLPPAKKAAKVVKRKRPLALAKAPKKARSAAPEQDASKMGRNREERRQNMKGRR